MDKVLLSQDEQEQLSNEIKDARYTDFEFKELDEGEKVFIASDETVDRQGESIAVDGWQLDNFKKNPILLWSHNPFEPAIGKADNIRKRTVNGKSALTFEPKFHRLSELSKLISDMVDQGWMKTVSVGFRPFEQEGTKFTKQELLEISFVNIPANPSAMSLAYSKGYGTETVSKVFEVEKGVIPFGDTPMAPKGMAWDGAGEMAACQGMMDLKAICAWFDSTNPDLKSSYKLPHHEAGGQHPVVWRGVTAAMAALLGARGGVNIPEADRKGVYNHLSKHYDQFGETAPQFREYDEAELKSMFPEEYPATQADLDQLNSEIKRLELAIRSAKPAKSQPVNADSGRREVELTKLLHIANKALDQALGLRKH